MGFLTPNDIKDFRDLYTLQLRYLLSAENQGVEGLQGSIKTADDEQLKQAFQSHMQETEVQAERLKQLIAEMDGEVDDKKCLVSTALSAAGANIVSESKAGPVRDAGLIGNAQKIEHFEIASYGTARDWARILDLPKHAEVLEQSLNEEKHANELLGTIAGKLNQAAVAA